MRLVLFSLNRCKPPRPLTGVVFPGAGTGQMEQIGVSSCTLLRVAIAATHQKMWLLQRFKRAFYSGYGSFVQSFWGATHQKFRFFAVFEVCVVLNVSGKAICLGYGCATLSQLLTKSLRIFAVLGCPVGY